MQIAEINKLWEKNHGSNETSVRCLWEQNYGSGRREVWQCISCGMTYSLDRMREMFSSLKMSVKGSSENVEQWKALVDTHLRAFDYEAAERAVKKILEVAPDDEFANTVYGKLREWKFLEIRNGILVKYHGCSANVEIPMGVTSIDQKAFYLCETLKSIAISDSVTSIGESAFEYCRSLQSVTIPKSVTSISSRAFRSCGSLQSVTILGRVTNIGWWVFSDCSSLQSVAIPDSVTQIGDHAFENCSSLQSIIIPYGVKEIECSTFLNCSSLQSITIPDNLKEIGNDAFEGCDSLTNVIASQKLLERFMSEFYAYYQIIDERKREGRCQHCGGKFNGFFISTCASCGKKKDY